MFVGQEHLNNYLAILKGIKIGYSGYIGYETYGQDKISRGKRVFFSSGLDPTNFKTWMRKKGIKNYEVAFKSTSSY